MLRSQPPLIVHVVYDFAVGGLQNGIVNLINRMPPQRWRHAIVSLTGVAREFAARIDREDVEVVSLDKPPGHLYRFYPRLYGLFRDRRPAIVHTRNLAALEALVPAWLAGVRARVHGEHGWDMQDHDGRSRRYRNVRRAFRPFVGEYVALSRHLEDYLRDQVGVRPARICQIYNGVDTARFCPNPGGRAPIAGCPFTDASDWRIGTVLRMEAVKDPLNLAAAFVHVAKVAPALAGNARLVLVGDGALRPEMNARIREAGLADRVWFAGERADVPDLLRGLDCFVLPSLAEGISNTILEAMATGLPVVATRVGGNAELIESGITGTLVPASDPVALANAIIEYRSDRPLARRHAKAARRLVESRFSLDRMVADYVAMYERVMARAPGRRTPSAGTHGVGRDSMRSPPAPG